MRGLLGISLAVVYFLFVYLINFSPCQKANCVLFVSGGVVGEFALVRVSYDLLEIFHKVSFNFSKKNCSKVAEKKNNNQKMLFVTKATQKLLRKTKPSLVWC